MKKQLKIEPSKVTELLGTVGSPLIVVTELIKNAIDAAASSIRICYNNDANSITITDDGKGFSLVDIQNLSNPGFSNKKVNGNIRNEKGFFYTGSKGLGLMSVFSLCDHLCIQTKNNLNEEYIIDWLKNDGNYSYENISATTNNIGTKITLNKVYPQVMALLTSESEIKKLRHISTYLYKSNYILLPDITLEINNDPSFSLLFKTDFLPMLYDVTYRFDCKTSQLSFQCIANNHSINSETVIIDSFDTASIERIMQKHYGIKEFIRTRTNDVYDANFESIEGIPSFEGRILVYERQTAGGILKDYGAGVNFYINDFALYNYLSDDLDWVGLADFSQRKKSTRLKPHNVFGYVNLPDFDETKEQLKISNERADFIQDVVFVKLMYLIKGIIFFIILNIDLTEKKMKSKKKDYDYDTSTVRQINGSSEDTKSEDDAFSPRERIDSKEQSNSDDYEDRDDSTRDQSNKYEPKNEFKPQTSRRKFLSFTNEEGITIDRVKNSDDLGNKIYQTIYELSKLNILYYPYATVCLYRLLIESATQYASYNLSIEYNENDLSGSIRNVLNQWSNDRNTTRENKSRIAMWRDLISKRDLIKKLNLYIHYGALIDSGFIFDSWKSIKGYIYYCVKNNN